MQLLHIVGSPRGDRSVSSDIAAAFIDAWKNRHPDGTVDTFNVWETELLPFDGDALAAKYAGIAGVALSPQQEAVWTQVRAMADHFHKAQVIVFSVPMWNFGIPYRLKHLIDVVSQKDVLFHFDQRGITGMLTGRSVVVLAARGDTLGGNFPAELFEHQVTYMRAWARMVGVEDFHSVVAEKTLHGPDADLAARTQAREEAAALAARL